MYSHLSVIILADTGSPLSRLQKLSDSIESPLEKSSPLPHIQAASLHNNFNPLIPTLSRNPPENTAIHQSVTKPHVSSPHQFQTSTSYFPGSPMATDRQVPVMKNRPRRTGGLQRGPLICGTTFMTALTTNAFRPEDPDSWLIRMCVRGGRACCVRNPCQRSAGWDLMLC